MGRKLNDQERYHLHQNYWVPPKGYKFPEIKEKSQIRRFQVDWFNKYPWLRYSDQMNGAACIFCVMSYSPGQSVGKGTSAPGVFVKNVWSNWKKSDQLAEHNNHDYHKWAKAQALAFVERVGKGTTVAGLLNQQVAASNRGGSQLLPHHPHCSQDIRYDPSHNLLC